MIINEGINLDADPYYTWVSRQNSAKQPKSRKAHRFKFLKSRAQTDKLSDGAQTISVTAEVMWLRDLLPNFASNARVATYSYESDSRKADIKTSLRKCGEQFLNVLYQNRSCEKVSKAITGILRLSLLIVYIATSSTISFYWT